MKNLVFIIFVAVAAIQLYFPFNMIRQQEKIIQAGKAFHFKTAPLDPADPFRGKYVRLFYEANSFVTPDAESWARGGKVYVQLTEDSEGFVKIAGVSREVPSEGTDYVTANVQHTSGDQIFIQYPFETFYMEETKAPIAEQQYFEAQRDTNIVTYALVMVKDGNAVLEDVLIDGVSIREVEEDN